MISGIKLHNFRNYGDMEMSPLPGTNVIMGDNAQGKTNILEAIHICCLGKSHRGAKDNELVKHGETNAYIRLSVERRDGPRTIEVLMESGRKKISVSGVPIRRMSELMGHVNCIMFSPEDLYLVKGGPGLRRRFMDTSLCQTDPAYYSSLSGYNAATAQRNAVLRAIKRDTAMLDLFEETMARLGWEVMQKRQSFIEGIGMLADGIHTRLSGGESISLQYKRSIPADSAGELADHFLASRDDDTRRLTTTRGPHRDDIYIGVDGMDTRVYASQGQQRTAALSIKLAGADIMQAQTGEQPVVMLDDVLSELDAARQQALLKRVGGQVLITTANRLPDGLEGAGLFHVRDAEVTTGDNSL